MFWNNVVKSTINTFDDFVFFFVERTITAFTVGFFYGIIWLLIWRRFGIPVLTVTLAFIMSGFLAASLLFNTVLGQ